MKSPEHKWDQLIEAGYCLFEELLADGRESIEARIPQTNPDFTPWREREISGRRK